MFCHYLGEEKEKQQRYVHTRIITLHGDRHQRKTVVNGEIIAFVTGTFDRNNEEKQEIL